MSDSSRLTLQGPTVTIAGGAVTIRTQNNLALEAGLNVTVRAGADLSAMVGRNTAVQTSSTLALRSGSDLSLRSDAGTVLQAAGSLNLKGSMILLNGGTKPLATVGSQVQIPGQPNRQVVTGSPTVLGN
jgi:hypothetical protein